MKFLIDMPVSPSLGGGNYNEEEMKKLMERVLGTISPQEMEQSIVVVDKTRIRKIRLPIK